MVDGDETADSYKMSAELLQNKKGDKFKIMNYLLKAAGMYSDENRARAIECLEDIHNNLKGSTTVFGKEQYFRYLHLLAKSYDDLNEHVIAADIYFELARDIYKAKEKLEGDRIYSHLQVLKKFTAYLAKSLFLYDQQERYDSILRVARVYYKEFPILQLYESIHHELYFCYEHIIKAADMTGSRYFREYYSELDRKLRGEEEEPSVPTPLAPEQKY